LINKKPEIEPKKEIKAKVLTPPRVHNSCFLSFPVSLSSPIIEPSKREIINFMNKDIPIILFINNCWFTIFNYLLS